MTSAGVAVMIAALEALAASRDRTPPTRYVAFGPQGSDWLLVEVASRRVERITLPAKEVDGLAVSSDGMRFAYVAPAGNTKGVWSWKRGDAAPHLVESGAGKYSDPAIAPDGSIYFSRSPVNGRSHTFGTYAQVFRVRPDGTGLQQITDENGCHFGVSFTRRGQLQYIHTSCTAQSWVERVGQTAAPEILVAVVGSLAEATASPDGRSVLFVSDEPDSFVVHEVTGRNAPRVLFALDRRMRRVRVAYGRNKDEVLYQQGGKVWVLDHGSRTMLAAMEREALQ
jgi:WD40 repeat protein